MCGFSYMKIINHFGFTAKEFMGERLKIRILGVPYFGLL